MWPFDNMSITTVPMVFPGLTTSETWRFPFLNVLIRYVETLYYHTVKGVIQQFQSFAATPGISSRIT